VNTIKSAAGLKVLLVSQPASDGVFRHVEALADYLLRHGATVHLAYSDRAACDALPKLVERVKAAGGRSLNLQVGNRPGFADIPALIKLRALVQATRPDLIHAHSSKAGALVRGLALCGLKARVFYTAHAYYGMHAPASMKARFFHAIERLLGRYGTTVSVSSDEASFARDSLGVAAGNQRTVPNGVDCARFRPAQPEEKRALRVQFGLPREALVLGTVGRFSTQKDPHTTYTAIAQVMATAPELHFVHLGKGELEPEVDAILARTGLAERCHRIQYLADTAPFYRMLDGFALASLYEGMSYAVIESVASGLPIILSDAPGNRDFAGMGLDRLYRFPPKNPAAMAAAVQRWREESIRMGPTTIHREMALERFSLEAAFGRLIALYREILATPR
jgi:glycosyltransferase involved in cell wall biosynthesis